MRTKTAGEHTEKKFTTTWREICGRDNEQNAGTDSRRVLILPTIKQNLRIALECFYYIECKIKATVGKQRLVSCQFIVKNNAYHWPAVGSNSLYFESGCRCSKMRVQKSLQRTSDLSELTWTDVTAARPDESRLLKCGFWYL